MSEPENNTQTAEPPQARRSRQPVGGYDSPEPEGTNAPQGRKKQAKQPRSRRNYAAELAKLETKVEIAVKLLNTKMDDASNVCPIIGAVVELLT